MARIPYADTTTPEAQPLVQKIVAERGTLLHLYQMLLHSPPVAAGWLRYLTAIRQECKLPGAMRESRLRSGPSPSGVMATTMR